MLLIPGNDSEVPEKGSAESGPDTRFLQIRSGFSSNSTRQIVRGIFLQKLLPDIPHPGGSGIGAVGVAGHRAHQIVIQQFIGGALGARPNRPAKLPLLICTPYPFRYHWYTSPRFSWTNSYRSAVGDHRNHSQLRHLSQDPSGKSGILLKIKFHQRYRLPFRVIICCLPAAPADPG